ncbi:NO-inducible flavohemoprotein [Marinococcus halotolerans]|uniref:NO-inducible flavohemoprotein n=1 Tax=Marinococcus halotolerans TaxID=301092 RepID=UPI0003B31C0B|nr:NO-inducible flavohemoprotein [Marinococcus halotolerans]
MLAPQTIETVKATAPAIQANAAAIGNRFYEMLFVKAPELRNMFNQTNQETGVQPEALAYSVYQAGANIDRLEELRPMIERVAEKHRALDVRPEHYGLVGETLLEAVEEVLGDAATPEILDAWGEAYHALADIFIQKEAVKYEEVEAARGGWTGYRPFYVAEKVPESDVITSFYLKPQDGEAIIPQQPGQYLTLQADIEGEPYTHMRHYSLSDAPNENYYRISVKREDPENGNPAGIVSNYLHRDVNEGDVLLFAAPAGEFVMETEKMPIVLISGGVGVTPVMSMLNTLVQEDTKRNVTFIHAADSSKVHAMKARVEQLADTYSNIEAYTCYSAPTENDRTHRMFDKEGFIDADWLETVLPEEQADFYFCGPIPFMKVVNEILKDRGVPAERRHYEVFGPESTIE